MGRAQRASRTHHTRPRADCPSCKRSIAVTFNGTSTATLRPHVSEPGKPCPMSGRPLHRGVELH